MHVDTGKPGPLPASVVERCAATTGLYGGCHGASASGVNDLAADNVTASLQALSEDMHWSYVRWLANQRPATR